MWGFLEGVKITRNTAVDKANSLVTHSQLSNKVCTNQPWESS